MLPLLQHLGLPATDTQAGTFNVRVDDRIECCLHAGDPQVLTIVALVPISVPPSNDAHLNAMLATLMAFNLPGAVQPAITAGFEPEHGQFLLCTQQAWDQLDNTSAQALLVRVAKRAQSLGAVLDTSPDDQSTPLIDMA